MSPQPTYSLCIHVSFNGDPAVRVEAMSALTELEQALWPFRARANWGKLAPLSLAAERIEELYAGEPGGERPLDQFRAMCMRHDPSGVFRNDHINRMLFAHDGTIVPKLQCH